MPIFTETVEVEVDLDDFDEEDIVQYVKDLGYVVVEEETEIETDVMHEMKHAIWEYKYGSVTEAVKIIERVFPDLKGLSGKLS